MASFRNLLSSGFYSLGLNINKAKGKDVTKETTEGVVSDFLPELTLSISNEDLIKLTQHWERSWNQSATRANWISQVETNENYWKGKQFNRAEIETLRPLIDNFVFEGTETFLPAATRQNPEPLVELKSIEPQTEINTKFTQIIRNRLVDWADETKLRLKLKAVTRHWFLSLIGVGKMGWDIVNDRPSLKIIRPKRLILDPDATIDEDGYHGKFVGEYRKLEAGVIAQMLEKYGESNAVSVIKEVAKYNMGTEVQFIEWWTNEYMCWTIHSEVLLKKKNPHWNYDQEPQRAEERLQSAEASEGVTSGEREAPQDIAVEEENEQPTTEARKEESPVPSPFYQPKPKKGQNHLKSPTMPYRFLTVFNLGKTPVDETSLITQVLPQQDLVNKRLKQIDANADNANNGLVVSEERSGLTKEEAQQVAQAIRHGGVVVVPTGSPQDAVYKPPSSSLSSDIFNNMYDTRNRFREILGVKGIQSQGIQQEKTATGKILARGLDTDRIGGGITEYLEQFTDDIYNYAVQLMYVYDPILSEAFAKGATPPKIRISVKEGSLLPKDPVTKAEQAIQLAQSGAMSLVDLYKALEYPNPEEMAANVWLQQNAPQLLFKENQEVKQAIEAMSQQNQGPEKPPNIPYKELPPDGKAELAAQAGIRLDPQQLAAYELSTKAADAMIKERAKHLAPQRSALPAQSQKK